MDYYETKRGLSTSFLSLADFLTGAATIYAAVGVGYLSDRTTSSWGRRKPYVLVFTPLLAFSIAMLFAPGLAPSASAVPGWFAAFYALEQMSISALTVVVAAWGTSLTHGGSERAALYTVDAVMDLCGFLTGVLITAVGGSPRKTGVALALIFVVQNTLLVRVLKDEPVTLGLGAGTSTGTSTGAGASHQPQLQLQPQPVPFIPGLHLCFQNKEFMKLFSAASFGSIVGTTVNLLPIFLQVVMHVPGDEVERVYSVYVQVVVAAAFVAILGTRRLNARLGKVRTLQLGVASGALYGVLAFLASYGKVGGFYLTAVPAGACAGIAMVNGNVLLSNAIDYDTLKTSFKRQSFLQCLIFVPMTFVGVAGSAIPLSIITAFGGLEAGQGRSAPPAVVLTLRLWVSLVVTACLCISYSFLSGFRITEAVQEEIARQLQLREEGECVAPVDPLGDDEDEAGQASPHSAPEHQHQHQHQPPQEAAVVEVNLSASASASASSSSQTWIDVEGDAAAEGSAGPAWPPAPGFLELHFSARELALLTMAGGKRWKLLTYGLDLVGASVYALLLFVEAVAAVQERDDLTTAEVLSCLFLLFSGLAIYEAARLQAMREIHAMPDREVAKWARRRLTERGRREGVSPRLLRNPFVLVRRALIAHLIVGIVMATLLASLPSPV
jgi:glycoside/pentoside/hexuronide:cation symporter, GPH family